MTGSKSFITDFVKYAPAYSIPALIGLITIPIMTELFSPEDYGLYVLVTATISVLTTMADWPVSSVIRYYAAADRDNRLGSLKASTMAGFLLPLMLISGIFYVIVSLAKTALGEHLYHMMVIGIAVFVLGAAVDVSMSFLQARRKATFYTLFSIWRSIAGLGVGVGLVVVFGFGVDGLLLGAALSYIFTLPILFKFAIERFPKIGRISTSTLKDMIRYSIPLVIGNLAAWVLSLSDRYILELFRGSHEVGIYSASYGISEKSVLVLTSLFLLASTPISIQVWERDSEQKARDLISSVTRYYLLLCLPAAVGISVLTMPVTEVLIDKAYHEGFRIMPFIAFGVLLFGLQQRFHAGFIFYKKTSVLTVAIGAAGLVNVGLNLLLVPEYGYMAAAITKLIGYMVLLAIIIILSRRLFVWRFPCKSLLKAAIASAVMASVVYPIGNGLTVSPLINLVTGVIVGILVYIAMLFLLQEIQEEEIKLLREIGDKIHKRIQSRR
jgi:O-antigen/teichoic acid export membrane protein